MRERYKKTEVGVIPEDWSAGVLSDIIIQRKESFNPKLENNEKYIGLEHIEEASGRLLGIGNSNETSSVKNRFYKDDILFGKLRPYLRKYYLAEFNGVCVTEILTLVAKKSNNKFCYYKIQEENFIEYINNKTFGTKMPRTSWNDIKEYPICIPTLKEQEEISEILSTVDCQIDDTEMIIEKCKVLKKGLMQRLLTKGIGHKEFKKSEVGEIPIDWEVLDFFKFVEKIIDFRGRTPKKLGLDWGRGDILALSANNVKMGKIDFNIENYFASEELYEKWMSGSELSKGDILMTMEAPLGNVALVPDDKQYILSQRVVALKTKEFINNEFMLYMLMSDIVQNQLNMLATGTTAKGINQKNLSKVKVVIPTLEEQRKISEILLSIDNEIEEYEIKNKELENLKKGLMQQLLIGKIRVKI